MGEDTEEPVEGVLVEEVSEEEDSAGSGDTEVDNTSEGQGAVSSGKNLTSVDPVEGIHVEEVSEEKDSVGSEDTEEPVEGVLVEEISEEEDSAGSEDTEVDNTS